MNDAAELAAPLQTQKPGDAPVISVQGITMAFGQVIALDGVDIDFYPGQIHALLGENGAGKSTLMNIIAGALAPTSGALIIEGEEAGALSPDQAVLKGISIVHQTPALIPDLTVTENFALTVPQALRPALKDLGPWVRERLSRAGSTVPPETQCGDLPLAEQQLIEISRALATETKVLILDEPTAALDGDKVDLLFERVRAIAASGVAVVYITHRIPEIRALADVMTVLRDGRMRGTYDPATKTDDDIIALIAGREIDAVFPGKSTATGNTVLSVSGLTTSALRGIDFSAATGEIVGIAGVAGNGQPDVLRALAGLDPAQGTVAIRDRRLKLGSVTDSRRRGFAFMPADRAKEGIIKDFSIKENAAMSALSRFQSNAVMHFGREDTLTHDLAVRLGVKAPSTATTIGKLSGGNQQKVVLARVLLSQPDVILAEEPTQGVDAGARVAIYEQLRQAADNGTAVLVVSSDAIELEGLCDRVLVMSSGRIVADLTGANVTEQHMMEAMVSTESSEEAAPDPALENADSNPVSRTPFRRQTGVWGRSSARARDAAPSTVLSALMVAVLAIGLVVNIRFIGEANIYAVLLSATALGFVALGQYLVVMTGGIDLSVGPLTGVILVIGSFAWTDDGAASTGLGGTALMLLMACTVGAINGAMVVFVKIPPVAATLVTYIALQGVSLVLRPQVGGYIAVPILDAINFSFGAIPVAFVLLVVLALVIAFVLKRSLVGVRFRATGSAVAVATKLGVATQRQTFTAYVLASILTAIGGIMLIGEVGVGDPTQGVGFTLASITAVVVAGTLLRGGVGSPLAVVIGAVALQAMFALTNFMQLNSQWQYWVQGVIVIAAASFYVAVRRRSAKTL